MSPCNILTGFYKLYLYFTVLVDLDDEEFSFSCFHVVLYNLDLIFHYLLYNIFCVMSIVWKELLHWRYCLLISLLNIITFILLNITVIKYYFILFLIAIQLHFISERKPNDKAPFYLQPSNRLSNTFHISIYDYVHRTRWNRTVNQSIPENNARV